MQPQQHTKPDRKQANRFQFAGLFASQFADPGTAMAEARLGAVADRLDALLQASTGAGIGKVCRAIYLVYI